MEIIVEPGKFVIFTGPMFSGKTTELLKTARLYKIANKTIYIFKPKLDNRYEEDAICTHNKEAMSSLEINNLDDILPYLANRNFCVDAIFIDEYKFVKNGLHTILLDLCEKHGIDIYISGLALDSYRNPFEEMVNILPYGEVITFKAVCSMCKRFNALFTYRKSTKNKDQVCVGGSEIYEARCGSCYRK